MDLNAHPGPSHSPQLQTTPSLYCLSSRGRDRLEAWASPEPELLGDAGQARPVQAGVSAIPPLSQVAAPPRKATEPLSALGGSGSSCPLLQELSPQSALMLSENLTQEVGRSERNPAVSSRMPCLQTRAAQGAGLTGGVEDGAGSGGRLGGASPAPICLLLPPHPTPTAGPAVLQLPEAPP